MKKSMYKNFSISWFVLFSTKITVYSLIKLFMHKNSYKIVCNVWHVYIKVESFNSKTYSEFDIRDKSYINYCFTTPYILLLKMFYK